MASLSELLYDIKRISEHRKELTDKKIRKIYQSLSKSLDAFIADGYKKYADEEGRFYVSSLDAQNKKALFLREIAENVNSIAPEIKKEIMTLVDDTYSKSYQGMMNAFKKADTSEEFEEVTKDIDVNPNVLKNAVNNNISKLTLPAVLEKHRQEVIYQIQKELNIGLMQGDRYEKMAKRISERVNVSYNKAMNITRTETHRNIESGFMDCAEHIQEGLGDSELIYAVTWRTMKDERVRPNQRRKTKKGWVTSKSKNGANHQKMENATVKAGELFDLGGGVKAKAPSQTGVASHDCNCRCFLEYNLMTVEEFEKKTGGKGVNSLEHIDKKFDKIAFEFNENNLKNRANEILEKSKASEKHIQNMQYYAKTAMYEDRKDIKGAFAYIPKYDIMAYNTSSPYIEFYDIDFALIHELTHRADVLLYNSFENFEFRQAISETRKMVFDKKDEIQKWFDKGGKYEEDFALADIISALSRGEFNEYLPIGHDKEYWSDDTNIVLEIFANMSAIDILGSKSKEEFDYIFRKLYNAYKGILK